MLIKKGLELLPCRKEFATPYLKDYFPRWQNNTSPDDLGIIRFGFDLFPDALNPKYGVADWVRPTLYRILRWKEGMTKIDRAWAICTSRDFSKSTWLAKILPLYLTLVGQYGIYFKTDNLLPEADYIRIRAKNGEKAEEKLDNVTMEFRADIIRDMFGDLAPTIKEVRFEKLKDKAKLAILRNRYIIQAQGINSPARGANIRNRRPKVDISDDVENKENTKTHTTRTYNAKEILGEQFGGLSQDGLSVYVGNYVHQECLLAKMMKPNSGWNRLFFQASKFDSAGIERSGWRKRFSMKFIRNLGEWYKNQPDLGGYRIFRMEYYNELIADKDYKLQTWTGEFVHKGNFNYIERIMPDGSKELIRVNVIISGDPAISTAKSSSDGCVSAIAFGSDFNRYVLDIGLAKYDIRDRFYDLSLKPKILAMSIDEMSNVKRKGLVDEMARFIIRYHADGFVLENAGQQLAWFNDLKEDILKPLGLDHINGLPYHPRDEKVYKLETGLMNIVSAGRYFLKDDMTVKNAAEMQIKTFPSSKLDILDTWFNAEQLKKFPPKANIDTFGHPRKVVNESLYVPPKDVEAWMVL